MAIWQRLCTKFAAIGRYKCVHTNQPLECIVRIIPPLSLQKNQNTTIIAQVPFVRETIENLLIKVKAVLAANKCASAFWQSNLKNKNLHDEEIFTQSTESDDENDDDELPEDDDSLEDDCLSYEGSRETSVETTRRISKTNSDASSLMY